MQQRNRYLDILRGVAVFLMVFGHCFQYGNGTELIESTDFFYDIVFEVIYSFHMPLFMILSGYLFYYTALKYTENSAFFKNRFWRTIMPIIGWQTLHYLVLGIYKVCNGESITLLFVYQYIRSWFMNIWFLLAILTCSVIVYITRKYARDSAIVYFLVFVLTFVTPDFYVVTFSYQKYVYPCFLAGYFCAVYQKEVQKLVKRIGMGKLLAAFVICYIVLFSFWDIDAYIYITGYTLLNKADKLRQFGIDIYRMLIGLVGSGVVILFTKQLYDSKLMKKKVMDFCGMLFEKIGRESLCIYVLSCEMVHLILEAYSDYFHFSYLFTLLETAVFIFVCYWVSRGIRKLPWLSRIMLGGR